MWKSQISRNVLRLISLCLPILSFAGEIRKIDPTDYSKKYAVQNAACASEGLHSYFGFCFSQEYGKVIADDQTQISITIGIAIASFEYFYSNCEHSDFSSASDVLVKAKRVFDAENFFEETKAQKEALKNHVGRFHYCKTKVENDAAILNDLKWFKDMSGRYSAIAVSGNCFGRNVVTGNKSMEYAIGVGKDRLSLICDGSAMVDSVCHIWFGSSECGQPVRFIAQPTRYSHLLRQGIEKALAPEKHLRRLSASDSQLLRELAVDHCNPAAESKGVSGDLLQLCMPADASKVVLFIRGLCDRCDFEPVVLEKRVSQ